MWMARIERTCRPSVTTTEVDPSPMCTRTCASSSWHRSAARAAFTIAVVSSSASSGSMPARSHRLRTAFRSALGTAVTRSLVSSPEAAWGRKSTMTSSMFHCGSWLSISNLMTWPILASSRKGRLRSRKAARPASTAMPTVSSGIECVLAAFFRMLAASAAGSSTSPGNSPAS